MIRIINEDGYKTLKAIYKFYKQYKANQQKNKQSPGFSKEKQQGFKPFTKSDWNIYPGAQKFSDGSEPLIFKSKHVSIVLSGDPSGAWVEMEYHNGTENYVCERTFNKVNHATSMANAIAKEIEKDPKLSSEEFIDFSDSFGFDLIR